MVSSAGITFVMPASAISAAINAFPAPIAFRFTQGTSTRPATGSQTSPNKFPSAVAKASELSCGVPPAASTAAAAAIALALPTSAWHPPVAPAIIALLATTIPKAAEVKRNRTCCSWFKFIVSAIENTTPGKVPLAPAVGVAHTSPIAALTSFVPSAYCTPARTLSPDNVFPRSRYFFIFNASPPVKPVGENTPSPSTLRSTAFFIVCKFFSIFSQMYSRLCWVISISCSIMISEMGFFCSVANATNSLMVENIANFLPYHHANM